MPPSQAPHRRPAPAPSRRVPPARGPVRARTTRAPGGEAAPGAGRVAIVTGGAGGIGRALLARLGADGWRTVSWDLTADAPGADLALMADVTSAASLAAAAAETEARFGAPGALIVNAGILGPVAPCWEPGEAEIRRVLDTNLLSAFLTLHAVVPMMLANPAPALPGGGRGRIVLMSSVQAKEGTPLSGAYAASKAGLIALAKTAGKELAPHGILVNAVTPTVVRTAMERAIDPARRADLLARIPLGRFLEPEEVAAMVAFLCGPECSFSTGAVFDLSGGRATS
ncbi:MAG TPA: SDR family NAD(P)-dependent oxidoreductase [Acetobacteraceae bacterium]|nr:SDR family NAD(P)-dependent oxidoreductase [Acetobacteraceae bacterium]